MTYTQLARYVQGWHYIGAHGTIPLTTPWRSPLIIPFCLEIPPLFLGPSYLLGVPPLRVVWFPSILFPGCLYTDLPLPLPSPFSFPLPNGSPNSIMCLSTTTLRHRLHIVWYNYFFIVICYSLLSFIYFVHCSTFYSFYCSILFFDSFARCVLFKREKFNSDPVLCSRYFDPA